MSERFTTPVGRFVQGDPFKANTTDRTGAPRVVKTGPNAGQPSAQWFVALAIPKTPGVADWRQEPHPFFQTVQRVAMAEFPGLQWQRPNFAWKIQDGDSPLMNEAGRVINQIEGFAGNWVCSFTTSAAAPKCFARPDYAAHQQITDTARIKRGDYIMIDGNCAGNGQMVSNCGVYLNPDLISWEGYGQPIVSGPDAAATFGGAAPVLPAGASAVPVLAPAGAGAPPAYPVTVTTAGPVAPPPYAGFIQTAQGQTPVVTPVMPPAPPVPTYVPAHVMLPAANGATYEAMTALGWTDALLIQHGMMAA